MAFPLLRWTSNLRALTRIGTLHMTEPEPPVKNTAHLLVSGDYYRRYCPGYDH
jgi:hypothetical protein